jgi:putative phage-type endonuclease
MLGAIQSNVNPRISPVTDRAAWLAARRRGIGSSDAPAVCGESKWGDAATIYCRKLGLLPEPPETFRQRFGRLMEPVLLDLYREATGHDIAATQAFIVHPTIPYILATVDAIRDDGRLVEVKTVDSWMKHEWGEGPEDIPRAYLIQAHHQMIAHESDKADVYAQIGMSDPPRLYELGRNDKLVKAMLRLEADFMDCLESRRPPPPGEFADPAVHIAINGKGNGQTVVFGQAEADLAELYLSASETAKGAKEEQDLAKVRLLAALGPNTAGMLPDGRTVKRYTTDYPARVQEIQAYQSTMIRILKSKNGG